MNRGSISPVRVVAVMLGLSMAVVGGVIALGKRSEPASQTPVLEIRARTEVPAAADGASLRILGESEPALPADVVLTIAFDVQTVRHRRSREHQIKAEVLSEPGVPQLATDPKRLLAMGNLDLLADEVQRRTGKRLYARATREMSEWIKVGEPVEWWGATALIVIGVCVLTASLPIRRFGAKYRRGE